MRSDNIRGLSPTIRYPADLAVSITDEFAGSIMFVLDQVPAALEANILKFGLVRERFYGNRSVER